MGGDFTVHAHQREGLYALATCFILALHGTAMVLGSQSPHVDHESMLGLLHSKVYKNPCQYPSIPLCKSLALAFDPQCNNSFHIWHCACRLSIMHEAHELSVL